MALPSRDPMKNRDLDERFYVFSDKGEDKETTPSDEGDSIYDLTEAILTDEERSAKNALTQLWDLKNRVEDPTSINTIDTLIAHYQRKIDLMRSREKRIRSISDDSRELLFEKMKSENELKAIKTGISKCRAGIETLQTKLLELEKKETELAAVTEKITRELNNNNNEVINGLCSVVLSKVDAETAKNPKESFPVPSDIFNRDGSEEERAPFPISKVTTKEGLIVSQYYMDRMQPNTSRFIINSRFFAKKLTALYQNVHSKSVKTELILSIRDMLKRLMEHELPTAFETSLNELMNPQKLHLLEKAIVTADTFLIKEFSDKLNSKIEALGDNYFHLLKEQMERV